MDRGGSSRLFQLVLALCIAALGLLATQMIGQSPQVVTISDLPHIVGARSQSKKAPASIDGCSSLVAKQDDSGGQAEYIVIDDVKATDKTYNSTILRIRKAKGKLRHDWSYNEPLSRFAKAIEDHQTNCSLPVATNHLDNSFGIGSHIALWSQAMCNAMEAGTRLRSANPIWLWLDQTYCDMEQQAHKSPLLCYMPASEFRCGCDEQPPNFNTSDPRNVKAYQCALLKGQGEEILLEFRAATTEFLMQSISPLVIEEAKRQSGLLFGPDGAPDDLVTVHIRWGDKFWEMKLAVLSEYMEAISSLLHEKFGHNRTANIYVATEDPKVYREFQNATPPGWNVFYDLTVEELSPFRPTRGNRASHMSKNTRGRAGLAGFGSLLVALEAKFFVLTTGSNWSRLMNHLRTQIIDPRCDRCTKMIDLRPGVW